MHPGKGRHSELDVFQSEEPADANTSRGSIKLSEGLRGSGIRCSIRTLTIIGCLLTDRLAPFPSFVPFGKKPLNSNAVSCPRLQISEDLKVILTGNRPLGMKPKIKTCRSSDGTPSSSPPSHAQQLSSLPWAQNRKRKEAGVAPRSCRGSPGSILRPGARTDWS